MKRSLLLLVGMVTGVTLMAQHTTSTTSGTMMMGKKTRFGLDVGVNLSKYDLDKSEFANPSLAPTVKGKTSFHAGVFMDIPLSQVVSLKPQILYSRQGSELTQVTQTGTGSTSTKYDEDVAYIYVAPAALHLMSRQGFIFETGPQLGFLVSAEQDGPAPYNNSNIRNRRNPLDFMWNAGVGYLTPLGIGIHARYNYGFSNVLRAKNASMRERGEYHNRVIQLGIMYHFGGH